MLDVYGQMDLCKHTQAHTSIQLYPNRNCFAVAVTKYYNQKQFMEGRIGLGLQFQRPSMVAG